MFYYKANWKYHTGDVKMFELVVRIKLNVI